MADVLPFVPLAEQPHNSGVLGCGKCGHYWAGVWPVRTAVRMLQCPRCGIQGMTLENPPRNADDPVMGS